MATRAAYLPDAAQRALLRACLFEGDAARAAFREWRGSVDLDDIDGASVRLLPLLVTRLTALGINDRQVGKYRGVQRLAWAQNQRLFNVARPLLGAMNAAGLHPLLLKGAALSSSLYPHLSMRPMGDLDLLVPRAETSRATDVLTAAGWRPFAELPHSAADFAFEHAMGFTAPGTDTLEVDLHWRLLPWHTQPDAEAKLWANAVPLPLLGEGAMTLGPSDMLLHVCAHGARWNPLPPIRWIADAVMILRHRTIDWDYFMGQADQLGLASAASAALDYLATEMNMDIPAGTRARLAATPVPQIDRLTFRLEQVPPEERPFLPYVRIHAHRALTMVGRSPLGLLRYARRARGDRTLGSTLRWLTQRARQARR